MGMFLHIWVWFCTYGYGFAHMGMVLHIWVCFCTYGYVFAHMGYGKPCHHVSTDQYNLNNLGGDHLCRIIFEICLSCSFFKMIFKVFPFSYYMVTRIQL